MKPTEDIRILMSLIRDLQEKVSHMEKEFNERINRLQNKIGELNANTKNKIDIEKTRKK